MVEKNIDGPEIKNTSGATNAMNQLWSIAKTNEQVWLHYRNNICKKPWEGVLNKHQVEELLTKYDKLKDAGVNIILVNFHLEPLWFVHKTVPIARSYNEGPLEIKRNGKIVKGPGMENFLKRSKKKYSHIKKKRMEAGEMLFRQCSFYGVSSDKVSAILDELEKQEKIRISQDFQAVHQMVFLKKSLKLKRGSKEKPLVYSKAVTYLVQTIQAAPMKVEVASMYAAELLKILGIQKTANHKAIEPYLAKGRQAISELN